MKDIKLDNNTILVVQGSFAIQNYKKAILNYFYDNPDRNIKLKYIKYKKKKVYEIYRDNKNLNFYLLKCKNRFKFGYLKNQGKI